MIYECFRITGAHDTVLDYADVFSIALCNNDVPEFDTSGMKFYYQYAKILQMKYGKVWTNYEYTGLRSSKPCWSCTSWKFIRGNRSLTTRSRTPW